MATRTPDSSPYAQRKHHSPVSDSSFHTYRSDDVSEDDDEVDRSFQSNREFDLSLKQSPTGDGASPKPRHRGSKDQGEEKLSFARPGLRSTSPRRSNTSSPGSQTTPENRNRHTSSPRPTKSSGSPSIYPDISEELNEISNKGSSKKKGRVAKHTPDVSPQTKHKENRQKSPDQNPPDSQNTVPGIFFCILIVIMVLMAIYLYSPEKIAKQETPLSRFGEGLARLKENFPEQDKRFWQTLSAATKRVINDEKPIQPGVILIGSTKSTRREADCLARLFSHVVTDAFQSTAPLSIDAAVDYAGVNPDDAKIALEGSLKSRLGAGAKSAVISSLEKLHGSTAMLLHAFCDNDNAPFTKVVIVFTLHTDEEKMTSKDGAKVESYLSNIWQQYLNYDDVHALLSRVGNNIIVAQKESESVLNNLCP